MSMNLKIDGLEEFKKDAQRASTEIRPIIYKAMANSVNAVKNSAQKLAPYKTGTLRRSIFTQIENNGFKGIISQDTNIAMYGPLQEFGTGSHDIYPVAKKALFWKGAMYPVSHVHHPGFAPHPFMMPALEENLDNIKGYFADAILKVVRIMGGKE